MKYISSITVTYNPNIDLLIRQITSLISQIDKVIIIDNSSTNIKLIEDLIAQHPTWITKVYLIKCSSNLGLGYAQNRGLDFAEEIRSSHILMLDQDSVLANDFVKKMFIAEHELDKQNVKVGAIGPVYFNELTGEVYPITKYIGPFIERMKPVDRTVEATFLIASGSFIKMEVLKEVGYMNEDFFIDYVDVEWCFRAKSKGFKMFVNPIVRMSHTIGDDRISILGRTISVHSPLRRYYLNRNSIYMIKNSSINIGYKIREISFNLLRLLIFMILSKEKIKYFKYSVNGMRDGFKGVIGKCPHNF